MRRRCITSWPTPSGRWRTCGPSAWSCSWQHWPNGHSFCVLMRLATARRGRPPTTSPTSTSVTLVGWADYRVTDYHAIERWWELVMRVATLVALESPAFTGPDPATASSPLLIHPHWDGGPGWKRTLNNLRLLLQPYVCACL